MLEKFNQNEKKLMDETVDKLSCFYPDSQSLERYLLDEATTGNSHTTLATFSTSTGEITLPITTRKYHDRIISQLYHSEFFKTQYSNIVDIQNINDLRGKYKWKSFNIPNSRAILDVCVSKIDPENILHSKNNISRYIRKYDLIIETNTYDCDFIRKTVDRFDTHNLKKTKKECIEADIFLNQKDDTRRYFTLKNQQGINRAILELQIQKNNDTIIIHHINTYYEKNDVSRNERTALVSYYKILQIAHTIAKEQGYEKLIIDFGVVFNFPYKLNIPGTVLGGNTLIFLKN